VADCCGDKNKLRNNKGKKWADEKTEEDRSAIIQRREQQQMKA
jgi:hypothetical protein